MISEPREFWTGRDGGAASPLFAGLLHEELRHGGNSDQVTIYSVTFLRDDTPVRSEAVLSGYRNFQHGWLGFAPGLDRGFLDLLESVETGRIAPVPLRNGNNVKADF